MRTFRGQEKVYKPKKREPTLRVLDSLFILDLFMLISKEMTLNRDEGAKTSITPFMPQRECTSLPCFFHRTHLDVRIQSLL